MERPTGFDLSIRPPGFVDAITQSSIVVTEIPGPFLGVSRGFSEEALAAQSMTMLSREPAKVGDLDGLLVKVGQTVRGAKTFKLLLLFGNEKESVLVAASYYEDQSGVESMLRDALKTVTWLHDEQVDLFENLSFSLRGAAEFELATRASDIVILTLGGEFPAKDPSDPIIMASSSLDMNAHISDIAKFALRRLQETPGLTEIEATSSEKVDINGAEGYRILASGLDSAKEKERFVYFTLLLGKRGYVTFHGICNIEDKDHYRPMFSAVLSTYESAD